MLGPTLLVLPQTSVCVMQVTSVVYYAHVKKTHTHTHTPRPGTYVPFSLSTGANCEAAGMSSETDAYACYAMLFYLNGYTGGVPSSSGSKPSYCSGSGSSGCVPFFFFSVSLRFSPLKLACQFKESTSHVCRAFNGVNSNLCGATYNCICWKTRAYLLLCRVL
jgi:hypothetical protein